MNSENVSLFVEKAKATGTSALSALFPRDFECYMVAFELCNGDGITLDYFTFPIMPSNIEIIDTPALKIQNTFGGVSALSSNIFTPKKISLSGNFGRNIKLLNRGSSLNLLVGGFLQRNITERSYGGGTPSKDTIEFNNNLKTGYGCNKVLQAIINRSYEIDRSTGKVNKLYFYNLAFGESFLVKCEQSKFSQSLQNNMMWDYFLNLQAICPIHLDKLRGKSGTAMAFGMSEVQKTTNSLLKSLS